MADQSYVRVNSLINVDLIKVDTNISDTFEQAMTQKEKMLSTTILHNSFKTSIDASYFSPEDPISGQNIEIYRKTPYQKYYDYVCTLEEGSYELYDFNIVNQEYYHYLASIELLQSTGESQYLVYQNVTDTGDLRYYHTNWSTWSICDIQETTDENIYVCSDKVWVLGYNIENADLVQNTSVTTWDTLYKYPKTSILSKNYSSSTFTGLLGEIREYDVYDITETQNDGQIIQTITKQTKYGYTERENNDLYARNEEKLLAWNEFISNGSLKLLKDIKGNKWVVQVQANPIKQINYQAYGMPTTISFDWVEILDSDTISIIGDL